MRLSVLLCLSVLVFSWPSLAQEKYPPLEVLMSSSKTVLGQPLKYPEGQAKMTAAIVTMSPGQETGPHIHPVPLFGYMLSGELTVDYGKDGKKVYRTGDSLIEAFKTVHDGKNTGTVPARILVVFAGAENVPNTTMMNK